MIAGSSPSDHDYFAQVTTRLQGGLEGLLSELQRERRTHSREVGRKAASAAKLLAEDQRRDLYEAAVLHDIGYAHPVTGLPRS